VNDAPPNRPNADVDRAPGAQPPGPATAAGVLLVALATLMFEVLLSRIFSVTMWYHYAFLAVSLAMFGLAGGALIVHAAQSRFASDPHRWLAMAALLFSLTTVLGVRGHLATSSLALALGADVELTMVLLTPAILWIPFVFGGVCIGLALTAFPAHVGRLYAADLAGAALACPAFVWTIAATDGPTMVFVTAAAAALAAVAFARRAGATALRRASAITAVVMVAAAAAHPALARRGYPLLRIVWSKNQAVAPVLEERWNSYSRIAVSGNPDVPHAPFGWGLSATLPPDARARELGLNIDGFAMTVLTGFDGDLRSVDHLKYDVTNFAHHIVDRARVLVLGVGGGRDLLSALAFDQRSVTGVEINETILEVVNGRFGDFTGRLARLPRVRIVNDDARSYATRTVERYDLVHASLTDTFTATTTGAFAFTENSLYTREAWRVFLRRLDDGGMLSFSRWYYDELPGEMYRLASLGAAALCDEGAARPRDHMAAVRRSGIGTLLVARRPLSAATIDRMRSAADRLQFELRLLPSSAAPPGARDPMLEALTDGCDAAALLAAYPLDITPPTDDRPFFFNMVRLRDALQWTLWERSPSAFNLKAALVLAVALTGSALLTAACIAYPLVGAPRGTRRRTAGLVAYFTCIGLGFMLIEISQMQRLTLFLGHPAFGLLAVLFTLLLAAGAGSWLTRIGRPRDARVALGALAGALVLFGVASPAVIEALQGAPTGVRIAAAVALLAPVGVLMGLPFPLGMRLAHERAPRLTPWLWGLNGAASVCGSALAFAIAMTAGTSRSFWTGGACYVLAMVAALMLQRSPASGRT
jgi:hypothetical protein